MDPAAYSVNYRLLCLKQGDRPLEDHVQDFLELAHLSDFPDHALVAFFRVNLNESLREWLPPASRCWTLLGFVEETLRVSGSPPTVGVLEDDAPPTKILPLSATIRLSTPVLTYTLPTSSASEPVCPAPAILEPARPTSSVRRRKRTRASASQSTPAPVCEPEPASPTVNQPEPLAPVVPEPAPVASTVPEPAPVASTVPEPTPVSK
ncbi:uncharacterized protein LOC127635553 [Xyrauchen texanus]|uniref:uncharacterized protein LOC127635553 n=1 Tax=Xyrauchen texanus TaxID=154827 RepID=UPI0022419DD7|nr:uncharacterized protein LOC127635553 [Xyrauchen texanus]